MREVVGQERLGRATGFSSMALSMGLLLGPVVGGVLYEYAGYFQTFLPALVLVGVELVLRMLIVEDRTRGIAVSSEDKMSEEGRDHGVDSSARETENEQEQEGLGAATDTISTDERSPSAIESQPLLPTPPPPPHHNQIPPTTTTTSIAKL